MDVRFIHAAFSHENANVYRGRAGRFSISKTPDRDLRYNILLGGAMAGITNGNVVREVVLDSHSRLIVVTLGDDMEWGIVTDGRVEVESHMLYGDVNVALRDGLMFATTDLIPINVDGGDEDPALVGSHPGLVFYRRQPAST